jgi:hypothetical protein
MAKPGELALGIMPGVALAALGGVGEQHLAGEMTDQPGNPMGLHRRQQRIESPVVERAHLIERAGRKHRVEARIDTAIECCTLRRQKQFGDAGAAKERRQAVAVPVGDRTAGRL